MQSTLSASKYVALATHLRKLGENRVEGFLAPSRYLVPGFDCFHVRYLNDRILAQPSAASGLQFTGSTWVQR